MNPVYEGKIERKLRSGERGEEKKQNTRKSLSGPPFEEPEGVSRGLFALSFHDGGLQLIGRHGTWQYGGVFSRCARGWHHDEARRAAEA